MVEEKKNEGQQTHSLKVLEQGWGTGKVQRVTLIVRYFQRATFTFNIVKFRHKKAIFCRKFNNIYAELFFTVKSETFARFICYKYSM